MRYYFQEGDRPNTKKDSLSFGFITPLENAVLLRIDSKSSNDYIEFEIVSLPFSSFFLALFCTKYFQGRWLLVCGLQSGNARHYSGWQKCSNQRWLLSCRPIWADRGQFDAANWRLSNPIDVSCRQTNARLQHAKSVANRWKVESRLAKNWQAFHRSHGRNGFQRPKAFRFCQKSSPTHQNSR